MAERTPSKSKSVKQPKEVSGLSIRRPGELLPVNSIHTPQRQTLQYGCELSAATTDIELSMHYRCRIS